MNTLVLNKMKNEEFLEFGNSSLAFVKKENHENICFNDFNSMHTCDISSDAGPGGN